MKKMLFPLFICLLLQGCVSSTMVMTRGEQSSANAPLNEKKGGAIKYLADGWGSMIRKRRDDAYKKMHQFCDGPYNIINEGSESGGSVSLTTYQPVTATAITSSPESHYWLISFECARTDETKK